MLISSTLSPIIFSHAEGSLVMETGIVIGADFFLGVDLVDEEILSKGIDGLFSMAMEVVGGQRHAGGRTFLRGIGE